MTTQINQQSGPPLRVGHRLPLADIRELLSKDDVSSIEYVRDDGRTEAVFTPRTPEARGTC